MKKKTLVSLTVQDNFEVIFNKITLYEADSGIFFLIMDDGSEQDFFDAVKPYKSIKYVKHESPIGTGGSFITAYEYARDNGYDYLITLDPELASYKPEVDNILSNLKYGYDIVTCSRVLENPDYKSSGKDAIEITEIISSDICGTTGYDITDPLSLTRGCAVHSMEPLELVESGYAVLLQQIIQAAHFGLTLIEIPLEAPVKIGAEFTEDETLETFLRMMETEKFLYKKGGIQ